MRACTKPPGLSSRSTARTATRTPTVTPRPAGGSVKVDITTREQIVFPLEARPWLRAYEEFADLPDDRVVLAYSLAETASEKVMALADRARNEPRDV